MEERYDLFAPHAYEAYDMSKRGGPVLGEAVAPSLQGYREREAEPVTRRRSASPPTEMPAPHPRPQPQPDPLDAVADFVDQLYEAANPRAVLGNASSHQPNPTPQQTIPPAPPVPTQSLSKADQNDGAGDDGAEEGGPSDGDAAPSTLGRPGTSPEAESHTTPRPLTMFHRQLSRWPWQGYEEWLPTGPPSFVQHEFGLPEGLDLQGLRDFRAAREAFSNQHSDDLRELARLQADIGQKLLGWQQLPYKSRFRGGVMRETLRLMGSEAMLRLRLTTAGPEVPDRLDLPDHPTHKYASALLDMPTDKTQRFIDMNAERIEPYAMYLVDSLHMLRRWRALHRKDMRTEDEWKEIDKLGENISRLKRTMPDWTAMARVQGFEWDEVGSGAGENRGSGSKGKMAAVEDALPPPDADVPGDAQDPFTKGIESEPMALDDAAALEQWQW